MARIVRRFTVDRDATEVFDAIADFSMTARWDPGVRSAAPLDEPAVGPGARFAVTLDVGPFGPRLVYTTTAYQRPHRVVLHTRSALVEGTDEVTVEADDDHAVVTWQADFALRGPLGRLLDPLLARGFEGVGDTAVVGLTAWLRGGGTARHDAA